MNNEERIMKLKYSTMGSTVHRNQKTYRMAAMKKARTQKHIESSRDYLILANSIHGKKRIESRQRVNKLLVQKLES